MFANVLFVNSTKVRLLDPPKTFPIVYLILHIPCTPDFITVHGQSL